MTSTEQGYRKADHPWRGFDRWECDRCPFDSLNEAKMVEHVATAHRPPPDRRPIVGVVLGPDGKPIGDRPLTDAEQAEQAPEPAAPIDLAAKAENAKKPAEKAKKPKPRTKSTAKPSRSKSTKSKE